MTLTGASASFPFEVGASWPSSGAARVRIRDSLQEPRKRLQPVGLTLTFPFNPRPRPFLFSALHLDANLFFVITRHLPSLEGNLKALRPYSIHFHTFTDLSPWSPIATNSGYVVPSDKQAPGGKPLVIAEHAARLARLARLARFTSWLTKPYRRRNTCSILSTPPNPVKRPVRAARPMPPPKATRRRRRRAN